MARNAPQMHDPILEMLSAAGRQDCLQCQAFDGGVTLKQCGNVLLAGLTLEGVMLCGGAPMVTART